MSSLESLEREARAAEAELEKLRESASGIRRAIATGNPVEVVSPPQADAPAPGFNEFVKQLNELERELLAEKLQRQRAESGLQDNQLRLAELELSARTADARIARIRAIADDTREELSRMQSTGTELYGAFHGFLERLERKGATPVMLDAGRILLENWAAESARLARLDELAAELAALAPSREP